VQFAVAQSVGATHVLPFAHEGHVLPPQSVSDSPPLRTPSLQVAAAHTPLTQLVLAQSPLTLH